LTHIYIFMIDFSSWHVSQTTNDLSKNTLADPGGTRRAPSNDRGPMIFYVPKAKFPYCFATFAIDFF